MTHYRSPPTAYLSHNVQQRTIAGKLMFNLTTAALCTAQHILEIKNSHEHIFILNLNVDQLGTIHKQTVVFLCSAFIVEHDGGNEIILLRRTAKIK